MRLFLVRHGETDHNRDHLTLGRADVPLNDTGLRQAEALARALAKEEIAAVYTSPLQRARQTAGPIAAAHGLEATADDGLIEMDIGQMEGLTYRDLREKFPDWLQLWLSAGGPQQAMPGGGERLVDVRDRAWAAFTAITERHRGESVCVVTHNFVILMLLAQVMGLDLANFRRLRHAVAAISRIEEGPAGLQITSLNDTCHLDGIT
jgi:broad specificity phosphatase PhoE